MHVPSPEELEQARQQGADDAVATVRRLAPEEPLLRVAWAAGFGATDQVRAAVDAAREAGATWAQIAVVVGERDRRYAELKFGGGVERQRRWRARRRGERTDES